MPAISHIVNPSKLLASFLDPAPCIPNGAPSVLIAEPASAVLEVSAPALLLDAVVAVPDVRELNPLEVVPVIVVEVEVVCPTTTTACEDAEDVAITLEDAAADAIALDDAAADAPIGPPPNGTGVALPPSLLPPPGIPLIGFPPPTVTGIIPTRPPSLVVI